MNPTTPDSPTTVVIRTAEDLLAHIPCVLGFQPANSIVMVACCGSAMYARVDLPGSEADRCEVAGQLIEAAEGNDVASVALVVYADDPHAARLALGEIGVRFLLAGVGVDVALRVSDSHWFLMLPGDPAPEVPGVPFDCSTHPFVAQAVLAGQVTHGSREALVASVQPDPARLATVTALLATTPVAPRADPEDEAAWVIATVLRHVADRTQPSDAELVRFLRGLRHERSVEELISLLDRDVARGHVDFWSSLVPSLPADFVADAAGMLALAAWLAGDGALAWCAIDRVEASPHESAVSEFVAVMLEKAVSPKTWAA